MDEVVILIENRSLKPLADARSAGWEEKAKGFFLFNLADKVRHGILSIHNFVCIISPFG